MTENFFTHLSPAAKKTKILSKGDFLFRQNDPTFAMFFLQKGQIQLIRHGQDGEQIILHHAHSGETFAEASLFSDHYHCDAVALENVKLQLYDKRYILQQMQQNPTFSMAISAHFAGQIQAHRRRLEIHSIRRADQRIFSALLAGLTMDDIKSFAAKIGLTHEATYRGLAKLVSQGKLHKTARGKYSLRCE